MLKKTIATMFSGGGGFDLGSIACGYTPVFGIDNNSDAVDCYRKNIGDHIVLGDVRSHDYSGIKADHLHASPSCKAMSSANANRGETDFDIECAEAVCRAIAQIQSDTFTLENVGGYFHTESFGNIYRCLDANNYSTQSDIYNAADFGVPQRRNRFILMARKKDSLPLRPLVLTHSCLKLKTQVGWYKAIADLIPTLKETKLADWQIKALPDEIREWRLAGNDLEGSERRQSIYAKSFLLENTGARSDRPLQYRAATEPSWTIRAMGQDSHYHKANILINGKVYLWDTRCMARIMSVPDSYILPDRNSIAGMILGNMVPPLLAKAVMESFGNV